MINIRDFQLYKSECESDLEYKVWYESEECQLEQELSSLEHHLESNDENPEYEWLSTAPSMMDAEDRTPDAYMLRRYFQIVRRIDELKAEANATTKLH